LCLVEKYAKLTVIQLKPQNKFKETYPCREGDHDSFAIVYGITNKDATLVDGQ